MTDAPERAADAEQATMKPGAPHLNDVQFVAAIAREWETNPSSAVTHLQARLRGAMRAALVMVLVEVGNYGDSLDECSHVVDDICDIIHRAAAAAGVDVGA